MVPTKRSLASLVRLANHDFCPEANRYVYWLKEPVGWFVVATLTSVLVGAFLSPLGWTVAAGLLAIIALGLVFPWLAVRGVDCTLAPVQSDIREREAAELELTVRNHLPFPILGLMIEDYWSPVTQSGPEVQHGAYSTPASCISSDLTFKQMGLARVPALSQASYRLPVQAEYRGRYPQVVPSITCAFPFGIWTARRTLLDVKPVTVLPMLIPLTGLLEFTGTRQAECGLGRREASLGDFMGVRDFRRGDSLRSIHWVQSARNDSLIVCQRGGPQQQTVELILSTCACEGTREELRENLAWRVRVVASIVDLLVSRHTPFRLTVDESVFALPMGHASLKRAWDILVDVPLDATDDSLGSMGPMQRVTASSRIIVAGVDEAGWPLAPHLIWVKFQFANQGPRCMDGMASQLIDLDQDIGDQLNGLFSEASHASHVA